MLKISHKILPYDLNPREKLKQKIIRVAAVLLFLSSFLTDVINARTGSNYLWSTLLFKNAFYLFPWGIAYLVTRKHKDLIKLYTPLYLSIVLFTGTCFTGYNSFNQTKRFENKFFNELRNIALQNESSVYSTNEYGSLAPLLNKFKQLAKVSRREDIAITQAIENALENAFTPDTFFNLMKIIEKKKKLEQLLVFIDKSEKKIKDVYSDCEMWANTDLTHKPYQALAKAIFSDKNEDKLLRQEARRVKKEIVQECITAFDFLSRVYGTYEVNTDGQLMFAYEDDLVTMNTHSERLAHLFKKEQQLIQRIEEIFRRAVNPSTSDTEKYSSNVSLNL